MQSEIAGVPVNKIVLHVVVVREMDLQPVHPLIQEVYLRLEPLLRVPLDRIMGIIPSGGWPSRLQEALSQRGQEVVHIVGCVVITGRERLPGKYSDYLIRSLKQVLVPARTKLLALGAGEIRTGALMFHKDTLPPPDERSDQWRESLVSLGFQQYLVLTTEEVVAGGQFEVVPPPGEGQGGIAEWAHLLLDRGYFLGAG
jgi:hypothetical protein